MSKYANSGAMWLIVEWQFAQMTADMSWKSTRPVPPCLAIAIDWNGHTPVYGDGAADVWRGRRDLGGELRAVERLLHPAHAAEREVREELLHHAGVR